MSKKKIELTKYEDIKNLKVEELTKREKLIILMERNNINNKIIADATGIVHYGLVSRTLKEVFENGKYPPLDTQANRILVFIQEKLGLRL